MKILVIDENPADLLIEADLLAHAGYTIIRAGSIVDGIRLITTRRPEVIVADVARFDGQSSDSEAVLRAMASIYDIPLIAVAGEDGRPWQQGILGCAGFILKPLDTRMFATEVARLARCAGAFENVSARQPAA